MDPGVSVRSAASRLHQFSPASIAGLQLWLDAASSRLWQDAGGTTAATADSDPVRRWDDLSGNGRNVTAPSDAARPTLKLAVQNSKPALRFDGVDDWLYYVPSSIDIGLQHTLFVVFGRANSSSAGTLLGGWPTDVMTQLRYDLNALYGVDSFLYVTEPGGQFLFFQCNPVPAPGVAHIATMSHTPDGGGDVALRLDGASIARGTGNPPFGSARYLRCVGAYGGDLPWGGDILEVCAYNSALSPTDIAAVEFYLNAKWGIY